MNACFSSEWRFQVYGQTTRRDWLDDAGTKRDASSPCLTRTCSPHCGTSRGGHGRRMECIGARAHPLATASWLHLRVHAAMLSLALVTRDRREAIGQLLRLVLAPLGTLTGRLPWGNSGRANVSAFKPSAIPDDLRDLLIAAGVTAAASNPNHGD